MSEHMKLPLRFDGHGINDATGERITKLSLRQYDITSGHAVLDERYKAISEFIVKACNSHEALTLLCCDLMAGVEAGNMLDDGEFFELRARFRDLIQA